MNSITHGCKERPSKMKNAPCYLHENCSICALRSSPERMYSYYSETDLGNSLMSNIPFLLIFLSFSVLVPKEIAHSIRGTESYFPGQV